MNRYDKAERVRQALHMWAYYDKRDVKSPQLKKERGQYHNQVLRQFEELIEPLFITSASGSEGGEVSIFAEVRGVNPPKKRK